MCKIPNLQYFKLDGLDIDCNVNIELPNCTLNYTIRRIGGYFLKNSANSFENDKIFKKLEIDSPKIFVKNIVGYECYGMFPEVGSKEDLLKVIITLDKECIKKFGDKNKQSEFKDGDYVSIMHNNELLWIMIFKQRSGNTIYRYANYSNTTKNLYLDEDGCITLTSNKIIRYATEEEQKILDDELFKKGLVWDAVNKKLVPVNTIAINPCETKVNISLCQENKFRGMSIKSYKECIEESKDTTMPIFNIGDKVKIKPRTKEFDKYAPYYVDDMVKYVGRIATVVNITPIGSIQLDIDCSIYYWPSETLEKVTEDEIVMTVDLAMNHTVNILASNTSKQTESEKINLFPTKKHYKFNFSIN